MDFTNINKNGGVEFSAKIIQKNGQDYKLLNATDIDWCGAKFDDGTVINSTGELLQYLYEHSGLTYNGGANILIEGNTITVTGLTNYDDTEIKDRIDDVDHQLKNELLKKADKEDLHKKVDSDVFSKEIEKNKNEILNTRSELSETKDGLSEKIENSVGNLETKITQSNASLNKIISDNKKEVTDLVNNTTKDITDILKTKSDKVVTDERFKNVEDSIVEINDFHKDAKKIVEAKEEPTDKDVLWLVEDEDDEYKGNDENVYELKNEIRSLKSTINALLSMVERHEYALTHTIAGGDFITNSLKYQMENQSKTEKPYGANDSNRYSKTNKIIESFDLFIANSSLGHYNKLYRGQKYYVKPRYFNSDGNEVSPENVLSLTVVSGNDTVATVKDNYLLEAVKEGDVNVIAVVITSDGRTFTKSYNVSFNYSEMPDYETYTEPNVRHLLVKKADTFEILSANTEYLCANEFVWCKDVEGLYIKAEAADGQYKLFKVNGSGSSPAESGNTSGNTSGDTSGDTSGSTFIGVEYTVNNGVLEMKSVDGSTSVDSDCILNINGVVDSDGILNLSNKEVTSKYGVVYDVVNNTLDIVSFDGSTYIDEGILVLNGTVDENGILNLNTIEVDNKTYDVKYTIDGAGILSVTSKDGSVTVNEDGILNIKGVVDNNDVLILNDKIADKNTYTVKYDVTADGTFDMSSKDGSVDVDEDGILKLNGNVDNDGVLNLNNKIEDNKNYTVKYDVNSNGILDLSSNDGSVSVDDDGILTLNGYVDEYGNLVLTNIEDNSEFDVKYDVNSNGILDLSSNDGSVYLDPENILTLNGNVDENGIINLDNIAKKTGNLSLTIDDNGILNIISDKSAIIGNDGVFIINANVDSDGNLLLEDKNNNNEGISINGDILNVISNNVRLDEDGYFVFDGNISEDGILSVSNQNINNGTLALNSSKIVDGILNISLASIGEDGILQI